MEPMELAQGTEAEARGWLRSDPRLMFQIASQMSHGKLLEPSMAVTKTCAEEVSLCSQLSGEEIVAGFEDVLLGREVDSALEWLHQAGVVQAFLPELAATRELEQEAGRHHKDVWEHTKLVVKQAVRRPAVRWGALLHDIGKVPTRRFTRHGVHFHGHAEVGARMFDKISARLPFEEELRKTIRFLIKYHLRSAQYETDWTDSAVRRFYTELDEHLRDLLDLSRADITSKRPGQRRRLLHQIHELSERIERLRLIDAKKPPLPKGLGSEIIAQLGVSPSKKLGDLMKVLAAKADSDEIESGREFSYYIDWIREQGEDFLAPYKD